MNSIHQLTEEERQARDDYMNQVFMLPCYHCDRMVEVSRHQYEIGDVPLNCRGYDGKGCYR